MRNEDDKAHCRARAHELWEAAGRPEGLHLEHWAQAQAEPGGSNEQTQAPQSINEEAGDTGARDVKNPMDPG